MVTFNLLPLLSWLLFTSLSAFIVSILCLLPYSFVSDSFYTFSYLHIIHSVFIPLYFSFPTCLSIISSLFTLLFLCFWLLSHLFGHSIMHCVFTPLCFYFILLVFSLLTLLATPPYLLPHYQARINLETARASFGNIQNNKPKIQRRLIWFGSPWAWRQHTSLIRLGRAGWLGAFFFFFFYSLAYFYSKLSRAWVGFLLCFWAFVESEVKFSFVFSFRFQPVSEKDEGNWW